jgi:orotate phosphoribosyltransferase-like protein
MYTGLKKERVDLIRFLISKGRSSAEIADRMALSLNTIRWIRINPQFRGEERRTT